jgi:hypothetical protein
MQARPAAALPALIRVFAPWLRRAIGAQMAIDRHHPHDPPLWRMWR